MRIGIVGAGRIGGNAGRLFAGAGHEVMFSGSRDQAKLDRLAADAGGARTGSPREAVEFGEVVMFSVPWRAVDDVFAQTGSLDGNVVIDTTNQYGEGGWEQLPKPAAQVNAERMPGARLVKAFNTLTSGFQGEACAQALAQSSKAGPVSALVAASTVPPCTTVRRVNMVMVGPPL